MIQANELRIDNLLFDRENRICRVELLSIEDFKAPAIKGAITSLPNKPIPLTEEILLKCGFENKNGRYGVFYYIEPFSMLRLFFDKKELIIVKKENDRYIWIQKVSYLHQLQNLYFALTGKELNITFP